MANPDITFEEKSAIEESMNYVVQRKNAMLDLFEQFGASVNNVYNQSQGKYAESYKSEYESLKPIFTSFDEAMTQMSEDLGITLQVTEESDAATAKKADALNEVK